MAWGNLKKRKDVCDFLRKQSANIFLLQETHWKTGAENVIDHSGVLNVLLLGQTVQVKE